MGNGSDYFKVILYFALVLFSMALIILPFNSYNSPGFVVTLLVLVINGITAGAAYIFIRRNKNKYK